MCAIKIIITENLTSLKLKKQKHKQKQTKKKPHENPNCQAVLPNQLVN